MRSEEQHEESIDPAERWTSDLSLEHDELLAQKCVLCDQLRLSSGKIARKTADEAVVRRLGSGDEAALEQMAGGAHEPVDGMGKTVQHRDCVLRARIDKAVQRSWQHAGRRIRHVFAPLSRETPKQNVPNSTGAGVDCA
ncbi:MAG: hypothetical protein NVSMB22_19600 [Chloroflexota bacterium]